MDKQPKLVPPQDETKIEFEDLSENAQKEISHLINIENFLRRVKDISGDEAYAYVNAREFLKQRAALIRVSEEARIKAIRAKSAAGEKSSESKEDSAK